MKTLDQLIRIALLQNNRSIHHYYLFYSFACSAINDFNIDHVGTSRTQIIQSDGSYILDEDYAGVFEVGFINAGHFIPFEKNDSFDVDMFRKSTSYTNSPFVHVKITDGTLVSRGIQLEHFREQGAALPVGVDGTATSELFTNARGENIGGFYGAALENREGFKIDHTTGDIAIIAGGYNSMIAIRYATAESDINPSTIIPKSGHNFVIAAIRHFHAERTRSADRYDKMSSKQEFLDEYEKYQSRTTRFSPEQLLSALSRGTHQAPKK